MISIAKDALKALKTGNELKNPSKWKKTQVLATAIGTILILVLKYVVPDLTLPAGLIDDISSGIIGLVVSSNMYLTVATSKKVSITMRDKK